MIKQIFKEFYKASGGFALLDLAVSMAVSSVLIGGMATSIHQLMSFPTDIESGSVAIQQSQNFSYWISRDGQMAQTVSIGDNPNTTENETLSFSWVGVKRTDANNNDYIDTFTVLYLYDSGKLSRYRHLHTDKYSSNGNLVGFTDSETTAAIAEYVSDIQGIVSNAELTVAATFSFNGAQVQRTYGITPRANIMN